MFTAKECRAFGDPHVTTFDGVNNDVYGVTTYVLAQSKSSAQSVRRFRVRMVTKKYAKGSVADKALLDLYDKTGTHVATVKIAYKSGESNLYTLANQWKEETLE